MVLVLAPAGALLLVSRTTSGLAATRPASKPCQDQCRACSPPDALAHGCACAPPPPLPPGLCTFRLQVDHSRYLYMPVLNGFRAPAAEDDKTTPSAMYKRYKLSEEKTFASFFHPEKAPILGLIEQFTLKKGKFSIPGYPQKVSSCGAATGGGGWEWCHAGETGGTADAMRPAFSGSRAPHRFVGHLTMRPMLRSRARCLLPGRTATRRSVASNRVHAWHRP